MKFFNRFFEKQWFRQWLGYIRSIYMLALLAVVILLTGILCAEAGREDEATLSVVERQSNEETVPSSAEMNAGVLEMQVWDPVGNGRLFRSGVPIYLETDLYFGFPEGTQKRRIQIGQQPWREADSSCYRLYYAQVCQLPTKQITICFAAYDKEGRYLEREFFFFVR